MPAASNSSVYCVNRSCEAVIVSTVLTAGMATGGTHRPLLDTAEPDVHARCCGRAGALVRLVRRAATRACGRVYVHDGDLSGDARGRGGRQRRRVEASLRLLTTLHTSPTTSGHRFTVPSTASPSIHSANLQCSSAVEHRRHFGKDCEPIESAPAPRINTFDGLGAVLPDGRRHAVSAYWNRFVRKTPTHGRLRLYPCYRSVGNRRSTEKSVSVSSSVRSAVTHC